MRDTENIIAESTVMPRRETITAVIIAKNEEKRIAHCLKSLAWVDEIIVIDDVSIDSTPSVAAQHGARVISHESGGNFDLQRTIGIDHATSDWILQLDVDEFIPYHLQSKIRDILEAGDKDIAAYTVRRRNFFLSRPMEYGGWYTDGIKLFRKGKGHYVGRSVHETLKIEGRVAAIDADIEHYPYESIEQLIERANHYSNREAQLMYEEQALRGLRKLKRHLFLRPIKLFWKSFFKKKGYREGMFGIVFSVLFAWGYFLRWAKYWELCEKNKVR
jgi:glycosyltransferase involved in cell wall biosynthesis